jgi:uncharacterized protein YdaU (DUF1376 family)
VAKDPAFLFYSSDFLVGTYTMTDEQVGQYVRLLCLQHQHGHLDESTMQTICKQDNSIMAKFKVDESGCYYNKRLDEEVSRRNDYSASRARNRQNKNIVQAQAKDMNNICSTHDEHMETETVTITNTPISISKTVGKNADIDGFNSFWESYPNKKAKPVALKAWKKLNPDIELITTIMSALEKQKGTEQWKKDGGQFIPHPATWLNQRRWEDKIVSSGKKVSFQNYDDQGETTDFVGIDLLAEARQT